jgi:membrane protease YdiL (CAAX protease family)
MSSWRWNIGRTLCVTGMVMHFAAVAVILWRPALGGAGIALIRVAFPALLLSGYPGVFGYLLISKRLVTDRLFLRWMTIATMPFVATIAWTLGVVGRAHPALIPTAVLATQIVPVLRSIHQFMSRMRGQSSDRRLSQCRTDLASLVTLSLWTTPLVWVLLFSYGTGPGGVGWTWPDIGAASIGGTGWALLYGGLICIPFALVRHAAMAKAQKIGWIKPGRAWNLSQSVPRGRIAAWFEAVSSGVISPIKEEIVYRGFFVFFLSRSFDNLALGIGVGLILFLLLHLYQGPWQWPSHLLFFAFVTVLTFSPLGLWSAIGLHIAWNTLCVLQQRRDALASRGFRRIHQWRLSTTALSRANSLE